MNIIEMDAVGKSYFNDEFETHVLKSINLIIKEGDYVKCSYEGTLDGTAVAELVPDKPMYGKQANTWEEAGSDKGLGVPAVAEGIVGMKAEEKKTVEEMYQKKTQQDVLQTRCARAAARAAASPRALIKSITASACVRSILPLRKARCVNSPGAAIRAPAAKTASSTERATTTPPCPLTSTTSSPV